LVLIAVTVGASAVAFAFTAGWFSPQRLTPDKMVDAFTPPAGAPPGHRKNHAKGICFIGIFESNGAGSTLSQAQVFTRGQYPALGRFNLATANPDAPDATVRVRGLGLRISTPDGQEWRTAMIDAPFFAVSTPRTFYELLLASASKDPNAMKTFAGAHPEITAFGAWAKNAPWTGSYAEERFKTASTALSSSTIPARRTRCDGRSCRRRNQFRSLPMISRSVAPTSWSKRSPSGFAAGRSAGP
jgi:catalase